MSKSRFKTTFSSQSIRWHLALISIATVGCRTTIASSTKDVGGDRPCTPGKIIDGPFGSKFSCIKAGSFMMGSPSNEAGRYDDEDPFHNVTISRAFELQTTEVTQLQWFEVTGRNPSRFKQRQHCRDEYKQVNGVSLCPNNPVENVSWEDAQEFIQTLNAKDDGYQYRLPSEAEWEYAARAGTIGLFGVSGDLDDFAWYDGNSKGRTHPVGKKNPNAWGLFDMHGNVWEWTADWYGSYPSSDVVDPRGPSLSFVHAFRGGVWSSSPKNCRAAIRGDESPEEPDGTLGFRIARTSR